VEGDDSRAEGEFGEVGTARCLGVVGGYPAVGGVDGMVRWEVILGPWAGLKERSMEVWDVRSAIFPV